MKENSAENILFYRDYWKFKKLFDNKRASKNIKYNYHGSTYSTSGYESESHELSEASFEHTVELSVYNEEEIVNANMINGMEPDNNLGNANIYPQNPNNFSTSLANQLEQPIPQVNSPEQPIPQVVYPKESPSSALPPNYNDIVDPNVAHNEEKPEKPSVDDNLNSENNPDPDPDPDPDPNPKSDPDPNPNEIAPKFPDFSVRVRCQHCHEVVNTCPVYENCAVTYGLCVSLCCIGCICCMWAPFLFKSLKDCVHYCSNCKMEIGRRCA